MKRLLCLLTCAALAACQAAPTATPAALPTATGAAVTTPTATPVAYPAAHNTPEAQGEEPLALQLLEVVNIPSRSENPDPAYVIDTTTLTLKGSTDPRVAAFNQLSAELVTNETTQFVGGLQGFPTPMPQELASTLQLSPQLLTTNGRVVSVLYTIGFYVQTAAHPNSYSHALNFDLETGRELALSDLFRAESPFLETIAAQSGQQLAAINYEIAFPEGATPTLENYRNWNVTAAGLQITFDAYQLAPYAAGPATITLPWADLSSIADPAGPIAAYLP
jgi:ABC-type amino acid transport substrate-binding protein